MIDEKKLIKDFMNQYSVFDNGTWNEAMDRAIELVEKAPKVGEWIPFKTRPTDEEEKELYESDFILDCELPDEYEDIFVTYRNGVVDKDIFLKDGWECYLESGCEFETEAIAWMPLPEAYKEKKNNG